MQEASSLAREVYAVLAGSRIGVVVAVWADGGVSAHRQLGFRHRSLPGGIREQPVMTFVAGPETPSAWDIEARLDEAFRQWEERCG